MIIANPGAASLPKKASANSRSSTYPTKRFHFGFDDFFTFDHVNGTINDWHRERSILASEDFIVGLIQGLEQEIGPASSMVMYQIGRAWGINDADYFQRWFQKEYKGTVADFNLSFVMEAWWWPFTSQGWGNWEVDLSEQKNGFMFVNIFDSAVARTLGDVGKPVCHIYAGLLGGFFGALTQKSLGCIEIQCYAMGETYCKFLLGKQERIDAATFWQNEGASRKDIEKRLVNGEYLQ